MTPGQDTAAIGAEIERLVQRLEALGDSPVKAEAQELVRLLLSLYGNGLSRMLDIVRTEGGGPDAVLRRLASDPLVASLLVLHDLHPDAVDIRVARALTALQPHLPHGTSLHLVAAEGTVVRVRADSSGRASTTGTRMAIERAIQEAAPEVATIHVEGLNDSAEPLIQIIRQP